MHRSRTACLAILTMLVLLSSLVLPTPAFAQDPLPPPADPPATEEAPPIDEQSTVTGNLTADGAAPPAETSLPEDAIAPAEPIAQTDEPLVSETSPTGPTALPEILDAAPEGTDVVVLGVDGEPLPLASNEAAAILSNGDPMWCPDGVAPGGIGCTPGYTTFNDLITDIYGGGASGNGTIYVAYNYVTGAADAGGITIDYADVSLGNLVIQGGYDFASKHIVGTSTIATDMTLWNWGGDQRPATLTLNDLNFTSGGGLDITDGNDTTTADIILNNVSVVGSDGYGAEIETAGDVTVNDSDFAENDYDGMYGYAGGDFEVNRSDFSRNRDTGLTVGAQGELTLRNVTANENVLGILAGSYGNATLSNVGANENEVAGVVAGSMADTQASGITANDNGYIGAAVGAIGDLTLTNASTSGNGGLGLGGIALGNASLSGVDANENDYVGVAALSLGNTTLNDVTANENGVGVVAGSLGGLPLMDIIETAYGMYTGEDIWEYYSLPEDIQDRLEEAEAIPANTSLNGIVANNNDYVGIVAGAAGNTSLNGVAANGNGYVGGVVVSGANSFVGNSAFNDNGMVGLGAASLLDGDVTVYRIAANGNDGYGVAMGSINLDLASFPPIVPSEVGSATLTCSVATGNAVAGLAAGSTIVIAGNDLSGNGSAEYVELFQGLVAQGYSVDCSLGGGSDYMAGRRAALRDIGCPDITLKEGDVTAVLHNLCGYEVSLDSPEPPGALPADAVLSSHVTIIGADLPVEGGFITLSFPVPAGADPESLAVLFWDGSQWKEVPGGSVVNGMFVVDVTQDGPHTLVQQ